MANKINIDIVSPDKNFYSGEADMLIVRALDGDMCIMYDHQPFVTPVSVGPFKIVDSGDKKIGAMAGGFLHVDGEKVTVISESVEWSNEIDAERAKSAKERAEKRLEDRSDDIDLQRAEVALKKAINRIHIAGRS